MVVLLSLLLMMSCSEDRASLILGEWQVIEAYRDGTPTSTLEDLYFKFMPNGLANSNMFGEDSDLTYVMQGEVLHLKWARGSVPEMDFDIIVLSSEQLRIRGSLSGMEFDLVLGRVDQNASGDF